MGFIVDQTLMKERFSIENIAIETIQNKIQREKKDQFKKYNKTSMS